jgi:glycosidase
MIKQKLQVLITVLLSMSMLVAGANLAKASGNDSDQALHFWLDGVTPTYTSGSTTIPWNASLVGSNSTSNVAAPFSCPANSTGAFIFVTKRGTERSGFTNYYAYNAAFLDPATKQLAQPQLKIPSLTSGTMFGVALRFTSDPLSLGISCTVDDGLTVIWASYRYITFTNVATGTWTAEAAPNGTQTSTPTTSPTSTSTATATPTSTPTSTTTATPSPTATESLAPIVPVSAPSWIYNATVYHVNVRNFSASGKLQAFRDQVPRLKKLGVTVISFSPLTPISAGSKHVGTLGSPYSVDDYQAFNTDLGTGTEFKFLVDYLHNNGMKVIVGWNAQSTGWEHPWITSHPDWYVQSNGSIISPAGTGNTDKALLDYSNASMRAAMITAMKYWITTYGIDGFNCAFAAQVPADFWDRATATLNATKADMLWIADNDSRADLKVNSFDSGFSDSFYNRLTNFKSGSLKLDGLKTAISQLPAPATAGWMPLNYLSNDFVNSQYSSNVKVFGSQSNALGMLTFTVPGNPMIFNGQEIAANIRFPLGNKGKLVWPKSSGTADLYKKLIVLRKVNQALWSGPTQTPPIAFNSGNSRVLAFERVSSANRVIVLVNLSTKTVTNARAYFTSAPGKMYKFSSGSAATLGSSLKYTLKPGAFEIYSTVAAK